MTQLIEVAGQGSFEFPDDMPDEEITKALASLSQPEDTRRKVGAGDVLESVGIGLEGFGVNLANTLEGVAGGVAGLVGADETRDRLMASVAARQKFNKEEMAGINQSTGSKIISGMSGVVPMLAAAPLGLPAMAGLGAAVPTISSGLEDISAGATTGQAMKQAGVGALTNTVAMAIPAGKGILAGAGLGAGSNVGADLLQDATGSAIFDRGNKELQDKYTPSLEKSLVAGASGAIPGAVFGHMGRDKAKPATPNIEDLGVKPPPQTSMVLKRALKEAEDNVTYNKQEQAKVEKKLKSKQDFLDNAPKIIDRQASKLAAVEAVLAKKKDPTKADLDAVADLREKLAETIQSVKDAPGVIEYYNKKIKEHTVDGEIAGRKVASITGEGHISETQIKKEQESLSKEDPNLVRARAEEEAMARLEQRVPEEESALDTDRSRETVLLDDIANLERFLNTKQGNKKTRAKVNEELVRTKSELDAHRQQGNLQKIEDNATPVMDEATAARFEEENQAMLNEQQSIPPEPRQPREQLGDRDSINAHINNTKQDIPKYPTPTLERIIANKKRKIAEINKQPQPIHPGSKAFIDNYLLPELALYEAELTKRNAETAITSPLTGKKFDLYKEDGSTKSATELVQEAIANTKSPLMASILNRLLGNKAVLGNVKVVDGTVALDAAGHGASFGQIGRVARFRAAVDALYVAHEMTHAAVNDVVTRYITGQGAPLSLAQRANVKTLVGYFNQIKGKQKDFSKEFQTALTDPREFIAYLSDKRFMDQVVAVTGNRNWIGKVWDTVTNLAKEAVGMAPKESKAFRQLVELRQTTNRLIETSEGFFTPEEMVVAYGKLIEGNEITAIKGKVQSVADIFTERDPMLVLNDLENQKKPVLNRLDLERSTFGNTSALVMAWKDSPVVRQVNAAVHKGEMLYEEGKRYIIDGGSNQKRMFMGVVRNLVDVAKDTSYSLTLENTGPKDRMDTGKALLRAHELEVNVTTLPEFNSLSPQGKKLAIAYRAATIRAHEWMNKQLAARGVKKMIDYKEGYIPQVRLGDFGVTLSVKTPGGDYVPAETQYFHTASQRDMFIARAQEVSPDLVVANKSTDVYKVSEKKDMERQQLQRELEENIRQASNPDGSIDPTILNNLRLASIQARYYGGHHMFQTATKGYMGNRSLRTPEQNNKDLLNSIFNYADELGRFERNKHIEEGTAAFLEHPDYVNSGNPDIEAGKIIRDRVMNSSETDWVKDGIDSAVSSVVAAVKQAKGSKDIVSGFPAKSVANRVSGVFTTLFTYGAMMGRLVFPIQQAASYLGQGPQYLAVQFKDSIATQARIMMDAHATAFDFRKGTEFDGIVEKLKMGRTYHPMMVNDFTQIRVELKNVTANKALGKTASAVSGKRLGELSDTFTRYMLSAVVYTKGKDLGLTGDELLNFVAGHTDVAAGLFSRTEKAPIITKTSVVGDAISPVTNYPIMQANWFLNALKIARKDGDYNPLLTVAITNMAMGGLASTQFIAELEILLMIINSATGSKIPSPTKEMMLLAGDARDAIGGGLGDVVESTMRYGALTGMGQAASSAMGGDTTVDWGSGLRYQSPFKAPLDPNKTMAESFTGYNCVISN
jgi:hypothetical protein